MLFLTFFYSLFSFSLASFLLIFDSGPIEGELRKPKIDSYTPDQSSETLHIENGIKFKVRKKIEKGNKKENEKGKKKNSQQSIELISLFLLWFLFLFFYSLTFSFSHLSSSLMYVM